ncbi:Alpha/Beta hydrolase protein [Suillus clintonianus]|uniref:Alpha/Beta hydrolase protein n=1 Tax=Suillus clintonianus TaxID=1904413 RepID=UPI001B86CFAE|nr:Alpha/Beta hydrolase protein [Suillus clintonianus]KAG2156170.1 Alpha/Beta hydrolase protein [Suillus clintonianus]
MTVAVPSASQWGSPTASRRALLIHGSNSSSHTFHRVASALAAKGYFVIAPNLTGHVLRQPRVDFQVQASANDLVPYLQAAEYDIVIGHSMGGLVVLSLLKFLSKTRPTSVVLVDSLVELTAEQIAHRRDMSSSDATTNPTAEDYMALNPLWTREDAIWRVLGTRIGRVNHDYHMNGNVPWSFSHMFAHKPAAAALTFLIADPRLGDASKLETVAKFKDVRAVIVPNASHWIQYEFPEVILLPATHSFMYYISISWGSPHQWGSPSASRRALLIHGLNSSSHTFHRRLPFHNIIGYLVIAPNLPGHALREPAVDFQVQTLANDLLPYLQAAEYDIVIGHSMGGLVVLSLLKYLPKTRPTSVVLVDSSVELTAEQIAHRRDMSSNDAKTNPTAEDYMALNPLWTREDAIWRVLGIPLQNHNGVDGFPQGNVPWSFSHLFADKPAAAALTFLIADPRFGDTSKLEIAAKFKDVRAVIVPNASHWIQYEFPEVIVEEALRNIKE